ncbi:hypothetical protein HDU87_002715 [Geranomyces variabilis]|uniref:Uncharacterized protein n=1 Tax=Geranomyces variabilis TaxID=109894 RepID=A0AAD5XQY8_9FUNG|nr:hypothetical protein HDU87_002715 [Geranomyces variabilis]
MPQPTPYSDAYVADATAAVAAADAECNADLKRTLWRLRVAADQAAAIIEASTTTAAQANRVSTPKSPNSLHVELNVHQTTSEPTAPTQPPTGAGSTAPSPAQIPHRLSPQLFQRTVGCGTTFLAAKTYTSEASQPERQPRTYRRANLRVRRPPSPFQRHAYIISPPRYPTSSAAAAPPSPTATSTSSTVSSISEARRPRESRNKPRRMLSGTRTQNPDAMVGVVEHALRAKSADAALIRMNTGLQRLATELTTFGAAPQPLEWEDIVKRRLRRKTPTLAHVQVD